MNKKNSIENAGGPRWGIIALIAIVVIVALASLAVVNRVNKVTGELLSPVQSLGTQAAKVLNPTPTVIPDPVTIIHNIQALARLETIQYTMEKVITAESGHAEALEFLFGDKLLLIAYGEVIAGIDMSKVEVEDLVLKNGVLYATLPSAEIFVAELDNEKTNVYDRDTGLFSQGNIDLETIARQAAEDAILEAALDDGILVQAEINAEHYLSRLFKALGYPDVVFEFADE
ncbi:MAG: DUF4230 domain-containing protein [Anaerolineales bacterium]|nr:DUF4230 domain-containing protein [Anaerolineales bacterium]